MNRIDDHDRDTRPLLAVFDSETTGLDVEEDRIVSAFLGVMDGTGHLLSGRDWLIDPGVPVPADATAVHGYTDLMLRGKTKPPAAIYEIVTGLLDAVDAGFPLVAYNASFDFTLLHREAYRHLHVRASLDALYARMTVLDPLVIDKALDPYRAGSRSLSAVAQHYGIEAPEGLHNATVDALLAGRLMLAIWRDTELRDYSASYLHERQITHARSQAGSYQDYLHSQTRHEEALTVRDTWPWHPREEDDDEGSR